MFSNKSKVLSLQARRKFLMRDEVRNSKIIAKIDRRIRKYSPAAE